MYECSQCGKSGRRLWLSKNGLCEKCAWKVYKGLSIHAKEALQRGISPLDADYEGRLEALDAQSMAANGAALQPARPPKAVKPLYKIWWVYALVGLILAAIALIVILTRQPAVNEERLDMGMPMPQDGGAMGEILFE